MRNKKLKNENETRGGGRRERERERKRARGGKETRPSCLNTAGNTLMDVPSNGGGGEEGTG